MGGRKPGCGFVSFGLFFAAGCGGLVMLVGAFLLTDWRANYRYQRNSCVVLDRRLQVQDVNIGPGVHGPTYHPEIRILYEVDGRKYELWTYDAVPTWGPDKGGQQAIVDSFQVGKTYPCWYDPDRPEKAILVRGHAWVPFLLLFVPLAFMTVGAIGMYNCAGEPREDRTRFVAEVAANPAVSLTLRHGLGLCCIGLPAIRSLLERDLYPPRHLHDCWPSRIKLGAAQHAGAGRVLHDPLSAGGSCLCRPGHGLGYY